MIETRHDFATVPSRILPYCIEKSATFGRARTATPKKALKAKVLFGRSEMTGRSGMNLNQSGACIFPDFIRKVQSAFNKFDDLPLFSIKVFI